MSLSWERFAMRGSDAGGNPDGWGVAYADGCEVQLMREPSPAVDSELVALLGRAGPEATTVISHVRKATTGDRTLSNTQPFTRVLAGRTHVFAHNGHVTGFEAPADPWLQPIGATDSERLFAVLLDRLLPLWSDGAPSLDARTEVVAGFADEMRPRGALNFLYYDGTTLFAHGHRRTIPGDGISSDPGLYLLRCPQPDPGEEDPCHGLHCVSDDPTRAVVATRPLGDRGWEPLEAGTLIRLEAGRVV
jgi:glutamine amidotransferase